MPANLAAKKINPFDPQFDPMLRSLQGNILKGHGREHAVLIFFQFLPGDIARSRRGVAALSARIVTSAARQRDETKLFKDFGIPGGIFGNVLLTAKGYAALGFTPAQVASLPEAPEAGIQSSFKEGMRAHAAELNDPPAAGWEPGYRDGAIEGMALIADDDAPFLLRQARELINLIQTFATVLVVERGDVLRNQDGEGIEHFGYVDGRSQPIYFADDLKDEGGTDKWDPSEPLSAVLVGDPLAPVGTADAFGSYFVFRKLEQDVLHFKLREQELADALGLKPEERERAGALAVGRFEDGTPLALSQTDGFVPSKENNFTYADDPNAAKCPFHAHIRKVNPRGDIVRKLVPGGDEAVLERSRRITRRGIPFGSRNAHPNAFQALDDLPTRGVGLLFMCFQASIARQFAFMQRSWADTPGFVQPNTGLDPVIGQAAVPQPPAPGQPPTGFTPPQRWPVQYGPQPDPLHPGQTKAPDTRPFSFSGFVKMRGGEFFFAPSLPFLQSLVAP